MSDLVLPSGTVSFLFSDIEGSTPLWDANPSGMGAALVDHDRIVRSAIAGRDGHIFSTAGDGYGVAFSRAIDAVEAGVSAQQGLTEHVWPQNVALRVRMGVHTGEVQERDGDYFGPPVNRAARLMGSAHGGQLVVSALTAQLLGNDHDLKLIDLGEVALKGIVDPVHVFGVSAEGLAWLDRPLVSAQPTAGNLPRPQTEMVGNLATLQERVAVLPQAGLVTLTGSGGVGKTRAAIEIGWLVVDEFADGVWMAELAPIAGPDAVVATVASMLGVQAQPDMTMIEAVIDWCLHRRMLLIIDNCEHVLDPVVELVTALVDACPTVTVLATSREPLGATGEQVIRIPSLDAERSAELFINRAIAADSSFLATTDDLSAIDAICSRLDGIPLAIELAAARTRSLSPTELLARLDDRFRLLRGGGRGGIERHQTLRAAVTWSYQLLSEPEKTLFDRLSVFAGTFDLAAAEAICAGGDVDEYGIIDLVSELVDKSMLIAERTNTGMRYRQLETLRQYGEEQLDIRNETAALRDTHLSHYRSVAEAAQAQLYTPEQLIAETTFAQTWDNLRAAHLWTITLEDLDAAQALILATTWYAANRLIHEHREWTNRTLRLCDSQADDRAVVLNSAAVWALVAADLASASALLKRAVAGDPDDPYVTSGLGLQCTIFLTTGQIEPALSVAAQLRGIDCSALPMDVQLSIASALANVRGITHEPTDGALLERLAAKHKSPSLLALAAHFRGTSAASRQPPDAEIAIREFSAAVAVAAVSSPYTLAFSQTNLAACTAYAGSTEAKTHTQESLMITHEARMWIGVRSALRCAARLLIDTHPEAAATIFGHYGADEAPPYSVWPLIHAPVVAAVAEMPDGDVWQANGAKMDGHEIVAYTMTQLDLLDAVNAHADDPAPLGSTQ